MEPKKLCSIGMGRFLSSSRNREFAELPLSPEHHLAPIAWRRGRAGGPSWFVVQMRIGGWIRRLPMLPISIVFAAALYLSGCASPSYKKADAASSSLQKAAMEINTQNRAIDSAMVALDDLVNKPATDLRPQFARFSACLDWLIDSSKRAENAAADASKKSEEYFQTWDKDLANINYQAVRDQSASRKTEVSNELTSVEGRYRENQAVVEPLISYLQDIRTSLSVDLTAGGIVAVRPLAENAQQNARKVQAALTQLSDDLTASGTRMSSLVSQDVQPKGEVSDTTQMTQRHTDSSTQ